MSLTLNGWFPLSFRLTPKKSKIKNITVYKSIAFLPRKEKTCEKWNFSLVVNMTSNDISKY